MSEKSVQNLKRLKDGDLPNSSILASYIRKGYVYTNVGRVALIFQTELTE